LFHFPLERRRTNEKGLGFMRTSFRKWSEHPYPGEQIPPKGSPEAGTWPMFFIIRGNDNHFFDPFNQRIDWEIKNPNTINWETELSIVSQTVNSLNTAQSNLAKYWGTVESTKRMTPIIFSLIEKYGLGSPHASRVLGCFHASINDAFVITWFLKYLWDVARPCQYDRNLYTVVPTPRFPAYPSAHATIAGCAEVLLSYFFPLESSEIKKVMEESAQSRLYAGVHFKVDNDEGLRLGRQIGELVTNLLKAQNLNSFR
jgi:hypothetical protein